MERVQHDELPYWYGVHLNHKSGKEEFLAPPPHNTLHRVSDQPLRTGRFPTDNEFLSSDHVTKLIPSWRKSHC